MPTVAAPSTPPLPLPELLRAEQLGVRLEYVGGLPLWESYPVYRHQKAVDRIRASIERSGQPSGGAPCACIDVADVSSIVNANERTVRSRVRDARKKLAELLKADPLFDPGTP